ncbi:MAG: hypothetical protein AAFX99_23960 [Myxococcota bacterium]
MSLTSSLLLLACARKTNSGTFEGCRFDERDLHLFVTGSLGVQPER